MTRKDFELIARTIRAIELEPIRRDTAARFNLALSAAYPSFNMSKFWTAATGETW